MFSVTTRNAGRVLAAAAFLAAVAFSAPASAAATVHSISKTGSPKNRVDLVILGDGYKASQMAKFATDAQKIIDAFFDLTPYKEYKNHFNIWRIDTPSSKSGASHSGNPGKTVYGAYYFCNGIQRLVCIVEDRVANVLANNLSPHQQDVVIVVVNDSEYGGSGGPYAVASTHESSGDLALHEIGHSFGNLDDEYDDDGGCGFYVPWGFNVTEETTRSQLPWKIWVKKSTPIPTPEDDFNDPRTGAFEGAFHCPDGWYRPTQTSMMKYLGYPFREVNGEQIIRRIHESVSPIDAVNPSPGELIVKPNKPRKFTVDTVDHESTTLKFTWRLGGKVISTTNEATVKRKDLNGEAQELVLTVKDETPQVRKDPNNLLMDKRTWTLSP